MATVIALHAHPDDEALLTGGTLALLASQGHRALVVYATDGAAGLSDETGALGAVRTAEAQRAVAALGLPPPRWLGYADSGEGDVDSRPPRAFADADVGEAAGRLAALLTAEHADVLLTYDEAGGYGHPDHRQAHRVALAAAALAGTPRVLQATVDRTLLRRVVRVLRVVPGLAAHLTAPRLGSGFTAREHLTHRIDVRSQLARKHAALAAHASQTTGGADLRTVALFLRLPRPLFTAVLRHEWFREDALLGDSPHRLRTDLGLGSPGDTVIPARQPVRPAADRTHPSRPGER